MTAAIRNPIGRGALLAALAAALFGLSTPLVQRHGVGLGPFTTAALLYAGAALLGALLRQPVEREARLQRADTRRLLAMALAGGVIGPVALAWGLQRTGGTGASLMLTLEAVFTALLARGLYHEALDRRVRLALLLLLAGGVLLVIDPGGQTRDGAAGWQGLLAVAVATAAWGVDNTLSRALADRDPGQVVMAKATLGATATAVLAVVLGEPLPTWPATLALLAVGATGYGLSLRFYLLAQRSFGAARTGSVFAFAPFVGALGAIAFGDRAWGPLLPCAGVLMLLGLALHLLESHGHAHAHEALEHEHAHRHDDGHHDHLHRAAPMAEHSHRHRHAPITHAHRHAPDLHHGHRH